MHITVTESLQKRRRRGGEQRGAEGSRGERKGEEGSREEGGEGQAQELMYHSASVPSTGPMLQCVFCSFHSRCSVTSVEKTRASWFKLGAVGMGKPIETKSSTRKCGYRRPQKGLSAVADLSLWSKHL